MRNASIYTIKKAELYSPKRQPLLSQDDSENNTSSKIGFGVFCNQGYELEAGRKWAWNFDRPVSETMIRARIKIGFK